MIFLGGAVSTLTLSTKIVQAPQFVDVDTEQIFRIVFSPASDYLYGKPDKLFLVPESESGV